MSTLQDVDSFLSAFNAENISQLGSRSESSSNALITSADPTDPTFVSSTQSFVHPGDLTLLDTRSDDFHEKICAVCENGGSLICCSGRCLRSFHPSCLGLHEHELTGSKGFQCADCGNRIHRCFKCKEFQLETSLIKCSLPFCGKFFHDSCTGGQRSDQEPFVCPLHTCAGCRESVHDGAKRNTIVRCFRCPKAYHLKCRPRDLHNLSLGLFLCIAHVNEDFELPSLPPELLSGNNPVKRSRLGGPRLAVDVDFRPGVIVQLDGIAPGTHMFSIKDAIKSIADVRFIEFNEKGATSALARMGDVRSAERLVAEASSARGLCVPQIRSSHKGSESSIKSYPSARILKSREEMEHWHRLFMCEGEEVRLSPIKHRRLEEHRAMGRTARLLTSRGDIYEGNGSFSPSHTGIAPSLSRTALALHGTSHVGFGGGINVNGAISHGLNYNNPTTFGGYQNSFTPLLGPSLSSNSWGGRSGGAGSTYWNTDYTGNIGGPPPYSANTTTNGDVLAEVRPSYYASDFSHQGAKRTYAPDGTPSSDSSALSYREEFSGQFAVQEGGEFSSHFQYPSSFRGYQRQNFHEDKILSLLGSNSVNPGHIAKEDDMYQAAQAGPGAVLNERKKPDADKLFQLLASAGMLPSPNL